MIVSLIKDVILLVIIPDVTRVTFLLSLDQLISTSKKMNILKFIFMLILAIAAFKSIKASPLPQEDDFDDSHDSVQPDPLHDGRRY